MKKTLLFSFIIALVTSLTVVAGYHFVTHKKTAYVRTGYLLAEYAGMQDANNTYDRERAKVQTNIDTLRSRYEVLQKRLETSDRSEKEKLLQRLSLAEDDYNRYTNKALSQLEERRLQLTNGVIAEVNSTIAEFGKKKGYHMIFGSTDAGSLLYGVEEIDITAEILEILNENFQPKENE